ncbi:MAG: NAD(P)H-hydrate dehydratase [Acidobacteria bacterium]|nr:NAD(P)H-hydrate dehydratase [Acidobacteriota bacterium]
MKVLTHEQMRNADLAAIAAGIPALVLMENAAYALLRALEQRYTPLQEQRIAIFCGKGNNGGDGLALARLLQIHHQPKNLKVILAFEPEELGPDAARQLAMLEALEIPYSMQLPQDLAATTLAIDALLGTGVNGEPRSPIAELITLINELPLARRVAVDIPSANRIHADLTVTFAAPKPEHLLLDSAKLVIAPIGIPEKYITSELNWTTPADLKPIGAKRALNSHKGNFGHVAVIGGGGALQMAGAAAIRVGAGWVTVYSPDPDFSIGLPDLMKGAWPPNVAGKVVAVGPGLGQNEKALVESLYLNHDGPLVLDADALNVLAPLSLPTSRLRVLTPHPGEMRRLLGRELGDRIEDASGLSKLTNSVVVLKGYRTVIAFPNGQVWINPTGSPALAKAGSGDVLTGLMAGLLSQYPSNPEQAVLAAVYLHGRLGELSHEMTSLASRLCDHLAEALDELSV